MKNLAWAFCVLIGLLWVQPEAALGCLQAGHITFSPTSVSVSADYGSSPSNTLFQVYNTGAGAFSYQITSNQAWVSVPGGSGSVSSGNYNIHTLEFDTDQLSVGPHSATITVTATSGYVDNSPAQMTVTLTITQPVIAKSTASLAQSVGQGRTDAANQTFWVRNSGTGALSYSITDNVSWLSVSPSSGSSSGEYDTITVDYGDTSALSPGAHNATITITGNANNSPQTIAVTLTVVAPDYRSTPKMYGDWN